MLGYAQAMTFLKADKFTSLAVKPHEYAKYFRCVYADGLLS